MGIGPNPASRFDTAALFRALVESSDDAIISKDLQGTITSWNRAAERMFGYAAPEAIGRSIRMIIPADRQDEETAVLDRMSSGGTNEHHQNIPGRKNSTCLPHSFTGLPIPKQCP